MGGVGGYGNEFFGKWCIEKEMMGGKLMCGL